MSSTQFIVVKRETRTCEKCHKTINQGETAYVRYGRYSVTYCLECHERSAEEWRSRRTLDDRKIKMIGFLVEERSTAELVNEFGNDYLHIIRKLKLEGVRIISRPENGDKFGDHKYSYHIDDRDADFIDVRKHPNIAMATLMEMLQEGAAPIEEIQRRFGEDYVFMLNKMEKSLQSALELTVDSVDGAERFLCITLRTTKEIETPRQVQLDLLSGISGRLDVARYGGLPQVQSVGIILCRTCPSH